MNNTKSQRKLFRRNSGSRPQVNEIIRGLTQCLSKSIDLPLPTATVQTTRHFAQRQHGGVIETALNSPQLWNMADCDLWLFGSFDEFAVNVLPLLWSFIGNVRKRCPFAIHVRDRSIVKIWLFKYGKLTFDR